MPRIRQFRNKYIAQDLRTWLSEEMRIRKINQVDMGLHLNVNQQEVSKKLRGVDRISADDLIVMFDVLGTDAETIGKLLKGVSVGHEKKVF